jgi:hypothetical protein
MKTLSNKHPKFDMDPQTFLNRKSKIVNRKLLIIPALLFLLLTSLSGCSPQRRLERLVARHPELRVADTLLIRDTIKLAPVAVDTALPLINLTDTVVIARDRLEIKLFRVHDTIHVLGKCKADTIVRELRIPMERIKLVKADGGVLSKLVWVLVAVGVIAMLYKIVTK